MASKTKVKTKEEPRPDLLRLVSPDRVEEREGQGWKKTGKKVKSLVVMTKPG